MSVVRWSEQMSVGDAGIDREHRQLVDIINDLHVALLTHQDRHSLHLLHRRLMCHLWAHFEHEEALMRACSYPGFAEHKRAHDDLLEKVRSIEDRLSDFRERPHNITVMQFIFKWLMKHMRESDTAVAPYLRSDSRSVA